MTTPGGIHINQDTEACKDHPVYWWILEPCWPHKGLVFRGTNILAISEFIHLIIKSFFYVFYSDIYPQQRKMFVRLLTDAVAFFNEGFYHFEYRPVVCIRVIFPLKFMGILFWFNLPSTVNPYLFTATELQYLHQTTKYICHCPYTEEHKASHAETSGVTMVIHWLEIPHGRLHMLSAKLQGSNSSIICMTWILFMDLKETLTSKWQERCEVWKDQSLI